MSKVDWSKAPEGADFSAGEAFYKRDGELILFYDKEIGVYKPSIFHSIDRLQTCYSIEPRPQQWPSESRIDIIGTNGNTAEHYMDETLHQTAKVHYETQAELAARLKAELEAKQKAEAKPQNKYDREIVGKYGSGKCIIDVYRVLVAFGDIPPEIQHAIKKLLAGGKRGHKNEGLDYLEAIQSIEAYLNRLDDSSDQHK